MTRLTVRVTPRASRDAVQGWDGEILRIRVAAAPVDGKANDAVIAFLSKLIRVPRSRISVATGATSRAKVLEVRGTSEQELHAALRLHAR